MLLSGRDDGQIVKIKALTERLRLENNVVFLGFVSDVSGLLSACDLGILCSGSEGYSNTVMEYGASGLPIVGNDVPGIAEAIAPENRQRALASSGDVDALADKIIGYLADAEAGKRDGAKNKEYVLAKHAPETALGKLLAIVERVGCARPS